MTGQCRSSLLRSSSHRMSIAYQRAQSSEERWSILEIISWDSILGKIDFTVPCMHEWMKGLLQYSMESKEVNDHGRFTLKPVNESYLLIQSFRSSRRTDVPTWNRQ